MKVSNPTDAVITHIRQMLHNGLLQPGQKLPAERKLAEEIGVGRTHVRNALQKLEYYGIINTFPQSGSIVASMRMPALEGLIADVLKIEPYDFASLVEMRLILESHAAQLCAANRTDEDIERIRAASDDFIANIATSERVDKDFIFHRTIAQASHNQVLASMLLVITPEIINYYNKHRFDCVPDDTVIREHTELVNAIINQEPEQAGSIARTHLKKLEIFAREITENAKRGAE